MKKRLLVMELWGLGDLSIAGRFLQTAADRFAVTLLAKPHAIEFAQIFCPTVTVVPWVAPWTAFHGKYRLHRWPWAELTRIRRQLSAEHFDVGVSVRPDPRDHFCLVAFGVRTRIGFPRLGSGVFLSRRIPAAPPMSHRFRNWQLLAEQLGFDLPGPGDPGFQSARPGQSGELVVIHSGAAQTPRIWPLERFANISVRIRATGRPVQIVCDASQRDWWVSHGESGVMVPGNLREYTSLLACARAFIGNDSGPGHVAALAGVPTFTIFGPVFPEHYAPLHPAARWSEGRPCPWKPCFDSCRFPAPNCILEVGTEEVWTRVNDFLDSSNQTAPP